MRFAIALALLPATVAVGLALGGCGSGGDASSAARSASTDASSAAVKRATVGTRSGALGTFLVDGRGRTLYLFEKDTGRRSRCSGACAQEWPPLTTRRKPVADSGARASRLSTSRRANGAKQVVYNGHPLYRYAPDTAPGQTLGQGSDAFGAIWYVLAPSGRAIISSASGAPAPTSTPDDPYGY